MIKIKYEELRKTNESEISDLETWAKANGREDLLDEWDYDKNDMLPNEIHPMSNKKAWWQCADNHSFNSTIRNRTEKGIGCPYCSARTIKKK